MNKRAAVASLVLLLGTGAHAQLDSLQPTVSFAAWRVMTAGSATMEGPYYYAPGKHRSEMGVEGQTVTAILREDRELLWTLLPQQNMYMEVSFDTRAPGTAGFEGSDIVESRELGDEEVNGQRTTKYEITVRDPGGQTAAGTLWATSQMIPVKMDMVVDGGEHVVVELRDIEIGPQPDELFEVPAGFTRLSLGNLGAIAEGFQGAAGGAAGSPQRGAPGAAADPSPAEDGAADGATEAATEGVRDGVRENVGRRLRGIFNRD